MVAGVIGATGYAGGELIRLLSRHPHVERIVAASSSRAGERLDAAYPAFWGQLDLTLVRPEEAVAEAGVVFSALPNGYAGPLALAAAGKGAAFIDMSADFRFGGDEQTYAAWYGLPFSGGALHGTSVYGLPELNRRAIAALGRARASAPAVIGNPGCYPTAVALAAYPALAGGVAGAGPVIADAASGISGAGREPAPAFHFPECSDSCTPYKVGSHRHTPEISRTLGAMERRAPDFPRRLIFTPHLAPMNRGILATVYIPLAGAEQARAPDGPPRPPGAAILEKAREIRARYADFYRNEPFVRVLPEGVLPATNRVRLSNYCDLAVNIDQHGETLIVSSAIDNMVKGAAGQAIQNMNILFGFDERAGLTAPPPLF